MRTEAHGGSAGALFVRVRHN